MKKGILLNCLTRCIFVALLLGFMPSPAHGEAGLKVISSSGISTSFGFSSAAKLTFVNETMTVLSPAGNVSATFTLSSVNSITFANVMTDGISNHILNRKISVYPNPAINTLSVAGVDAGVATIYSIVGAKIIETRLQDNLNKIDVSSLSPGVYVISVNGKSIKFNKK